MTVIYILWLPRVPVTNQHFAGQLAEMNAGYHSSIYYVKLTLPSTMYSTGETYSISDSDLALIKHKYDILLASFVKHILI